MPTLIITLSSGEQVTHDLTAASITIGRNEGNTIVLDEGSISGSHAEFRKSGDDYLLSDLDSTNGTLVNGEPAEDTRLRSGDQITFGNVNANYRTKPGAPRNEEGPALVPEASELSAAIAESSARPADFTSISPFPKKRKKKDPVAAAVMAIGIIGILFSIGVVICTAIMSSS